MKNWLKYLLNEIAIKVIFNLNIKKEIEDNNVRDLAIIEKIQALVADKKLKAEELRDYRFGKDGLNLIHLIASKNRPKICKFMLDNYSFGNTS